MTETARWYFSGMYVMTVGAPMLLDGDVNDRVGVRAATDRIMQRIEDLSAQSAGRLPITSAARAVAAAR
jgi:hypothetical protein